MDPDVKAILEDCNALDFLPIFAAKHVTMSDLIGFTVSDVKKVSLCILFFNILIFCQILLKAADILLLLFSAWSSG